MSLGKSSVQETKDVNWERSLLDLQRCFVSHLIDLIKCTLFLDTREDKRVKDYK